MKKLLNRLATLLLRRTLKRYGVYDPSYESMLRADPLGFAVRLHQMIEQEIKRRGSAS